MTTAGDDALIEQLLARIDALEQQQARTPAPFWRNTAAVGVLGGLIAIVPASLTAIREYYQTEREVRLNTTKYKHERTLSYLDRALSTETTEAKQAQVLRFLRTIPDESDPIRQWAEQELARVEELVEQLKQEAKGGEKKLEVLATEKAVLEAEAEQLRTTAEGSATSAEAVEPLLQANQDQQEQTLREIEKTQRKVQDAAVRAGAPELASPVMAPTVPTSGPSAPTTWRVRIAADRDLAEIERQAALAGTRGEGTPDVYAKNGMYYLFLGRFDARDAAIERVGEYKRLLGRGALVQDMEVFCPTPSKRGNVWICGER